MKERNQGKRLDDSMVVLLMLMMTDRLAGGRLGCGSAAVGAKQTAERLAETVSGGDARLLTCLVCIVVESVCVASQPFDCLSARRGD